MAPTEEAADMDEDSDATRVLACERLLRGSGLAYFILRPGELDDRVGGVTRLQFSQEEDRFLPSRSVPRADVAEVVVRALLDPRACNVACAVSESDYLPGRGKSSGPVEQDISKMLELLQPEKA